MSFSFKIIVMISDGRKIYCQKKHKTENRKIIAYAIMVFPTTETEEIRNRHFFLQYTANGIVLLA